MPLTDNHSSNSEQQPLLEDLNTLQPTTSDEPASTPMTPVFRRSGSIHEVGALLNLAYGNVLLVFVPIGIVAGALAAPAPAVFFFNFLAILPLAPLITMAVLRLSADAGVVRAGLVRAVFGNTEELLICLVALARCEIQLVQATIIGSVLTNSLLVLGACLLYASYDQLEVKFSGAQASIMSSLIMVVSISLSVPTVVSFAHQQESSSQHDIQEDALTLSRVTVVAILSLFVSYLVFRFKTHTNLFAKAYIPSGRVMEARLGFVPSPTSLVAILLTAAVCAALCSNYLVRSVGGTAKQLNLTKSFIGIVLLPLAGNAVKSLVTIAASRVRMLDFAIRSVMTGVLDTLLFITPFLVLLGWVVGRPMELDFGVFESVIFLLAMILMATLMHHGKCTYFEGFMLIGTYATIAFTFYMRPETQGEVFPPSF